MSELEHVELDPNGLVPIDSYVDISMKIVKIKHKLKQDHRQHHYETRREYLKQGLDGQYIQEIRRFEEMKQRYDAAILMAIV